MKILLVKISALGDGLDSTPFPRLLSMSGHIVDILTSNTCVPIWENNPFVRNLYCVNPSKVISFYNARNIFSFLFPLNHSGINSYQLIFVFHCSSKLRLVLKCLYPLARIFSMSHAISTSSILRYRTDKNRTFQEAFLLRLAGLALDQPGKLEFYPFEKQNQFKDYSKHFASGTKLIAVSVGGGNMVSSATSRRLSSEFIADLISSSRPNWYFLLLGHGTDDAFQANFIFSRISLDSSSKVTSFINQTSIHDAYNLISASGLFLGGDTGLSKLAAASGIPTLILFGPTSPDLAAPLGSKVNSVKSKSPCNTCYSPSDGLSSPMYSCIRPICMDHDVQYINVLIDSAVG